MRPPGKSQSRPLPLRGKRERVQPPQNRGVGNVAKEKAADALTALWGRTLARNNKSAANPAPACSGHFGHPMTRSDLRTETRGRHPLAKAAAAREDERSLAKTCRSKAE